MTRLKISVDNLPWLPVRNAGGSTFATGPVKIKIKPSKRGYVLPFVIVKHAPNLIGWPAIKKYRLHDEIYVNYSFSSRHHRPFPRLSTTMRTDYSDAPC